MTFVESRHCLSRAHCRTCRTDAAWRAKVGAPDVCPHGVTTGVGLGDLVERIAKPLARALGLPCYGPDGRLKPESGCAGRKAFLNRQRL